jgi:hypothetical protein
MLTANQERERHGNAQEYSATMIANEADEIEQNANEMRQHQEWL